MDASLEESKQVQAEISAAQGRFQGKRVTPSQLLALILLKRGWLVTWDCSGDWQCAHKCKAEKLGMVRAIYPNTLKALVTRGMVRQLDNGVYAYRFELVR